ncbi:aldehyde dehydrogenase family protein [Ktedonosporobacter rubrisoli]|uniref:Aldehyde dehydrogenase family protein n=1 Tax=Ktedonosporobacter rubrisoli TaxID=2509675 RepID=A0A4P6K5I7_KTERU|nr:aldehyde dehydrogenase family protein [Ktedonosporobacter rubrisoli]
MNTLSHYVAGEWLAAKDEQWSEDLNPSDTTQILARVPQGQPAVVDRAVEAAQSAFRAWKATPGPAKAEILHKAANLLAQKRQELGTLVALEVGKPLGEAVPEVDRGVAILRYFAEEAVHPMGMVIPAQTAGSLQFSLRQPLGPVAIISPWNFPVAIPLWKMAPALAYGNTIVWKPAEVASFVATRLVEVLAEAGLPAGVLNLVLGKGSTIGNVLTGHKGIRGISFTGSDTVGMSIGETAAKNNIKYQLEMGGKNAAIVLADADLQQAAKLIAAGAMRFAGQKCTATSRAIVVSEVNDSFIDRLAAEIHTLPLAPANDPRSAIGPLVERSALEKVNYYAELGAKEGQIALGGKAPAEAPLKQGYFFEPTVVVGVSPDARIAQEEVFGPVLVVHQARSVEEAIAIANNSRYGLSVSLFTRDINAMLEYIHDIECGMVRINGDTTGVDPHAPFGGMKSSSSHSREQGPAALEFFTEVKTVQVNAAGA